MKVHDLPRHGHFQWQPVNVETRWWWKVSRSELQGQLGISGRFSKAGKAKEASDQPRQRDVTGAHCATCSLLLSATLHSTEIVSVWSLYFKLFEHV